MKRSKIKKYEKLLRKDEDWDYGYLLELERHKLKLMLAYFKDSQYVDTTYIVRDLKLCIKLLNIIMYDDPAYTSIVDNGDTFPHYVNLRNKNRFINCGEWFDNLTNVYLKQNMIGEIYAQKAWHLYNIIRDYRMRTWWD